MNKLRLFISVGLCGILFTGCGFIEGIFGDKSDKIAYRKASVKYKCIPEDLVERLASKKYYDGFMTYNSSFSSPEANFKYYTERYAGIFKDDRYDGVMFKCDDLVTGYYNEAIKKYADFSIKLPTNIKEEMELEKEWFVCDKLPFWLETTLDEYISQNKDDDIAYINASKFKGAWNDKLSGERVHTDRLGELGIGNEFNILLAVSNTNESMAKCVAYKTAIQAIENDLIDLGGGKKAKCSDLSYKDAQKCLNYFTSVYSKAYKDKKSELDAEQKEIDIKKERKKYEQINRQ